MRGNEGEFGEPEVTSNAYRCGVALRDRRHQTIRRQKRQRGRKQLRRRHQTSAAALATRSVGATAVCVLRLCRASARRAPPCCTFPCATASTNRALKLNSDSAELPVPSTPPSSASTESPTDAAAHSTIWHARCIMQTAKSRAIEENFLCSREKFIFALYLYLL